MRIERSLRNEITPVQLFEMVCSERYQEQKCIDVGALSYRVTVVRDGDTATVTVRRTMPTTGFPGLLRKLLPSGVTATETVHWGVANEAGARTASVNVVFHGMPTSLTGSLRVVPESARVTVLDVAVDFTAHLPLIGGRVERTAAPVILSVIDGEEATAKAWVAGRR